MLDTRKNRILQAIVQDYADTAEPIGSEWLVSRHDFGCKSATVRNEMAEMSDLGYLVQPHTSAGRIPSPRGYRYYVDRLMSVPAPAPEQAAIAFDADSLSIEDTVQLTCRVLADMTHYPSVATTPAADRTRLQRIYITPATADTVLVVLLLSSGHVEHKLIGVDRGTSTALLQVVTNFLNERIGGKALDEAASTQLGDLPPQIARYRAQAERIATAVLGAVQGLASQRLFLEGAAHILRQREFQDVLRLEQLLAVLEHKSVLYEVLRRSLAADDVTVVIGPESSVEQMSDCSVVTSQYRIAGRPGGFIGVVGPTRMHYDRTISAVGLMARSLSALLSGCASEQGQFG